jgi:AcrR family transcriptional regulator
MPDGHRERKKAQARAAMADAAADLFARHGYANVPMTQVAVAAGVSEQTLYNYFPTKESLVFDKSDVFEETLFTTIAEREPGVGPMDAYRRWLNQFMLGDAARLAIDSPGGMPRLIATSDALRRALLDMAHQTAGTLTARLVESDGYTLAHATVLADALLAVFVRTTERLGEAPNRRAVATIAAEANAALDILQPIADRN